MSARDTFNGAYAQLVEHLPLCLPRLPCARVTPYGHVEGLKCELTEEVNHNTTVESAVKIVESGTLKSGAVRHVLGQDAVSLSSCPTQSFGGNVKLVFDSKKILDKLRAMCYVNFGRIWDEKMMDSRPGPYEDVDRGLGKEATEEVNGPRGSNRVHAKYAVQRKIYDKECEYLAYEDIPLRGNLKRIEYWMPWRGFKAASYSHGCDGASPKHANVHNDLTDNLGMNIEKIKNAADRAGVDFDLKSCFTALKVARYGDNKFVPLTEENLEKMKEIPVVHFREEMYKMAVKDVPEECKC